MSAADDLTKLAEAIPWLKETPWFEEHLTCDPKQCELTRLFYEAAQLLADNRALNERDQTARFIIWMNHGHGELYGDDGEMQCRGFDFKRATWEQIRDHLDPEGIPLRSAMAAWLAADDAAQHKG
jgi:hypothetical protein